MRKKKQKKSLFSLNAVPYLGILLALKFQEDYSSEQHHCSENYYGDN